MANNEKLRSVLLEKILSDCLLYAEATDASPCDLTNVLMNASAYFLPLEIEDEDLRSLMGKAHRVMGEILERRKKAYQDVRTCQERDS